MGFLDFLKEKPRGKLKELPPAVKEVVEELRKVIDPETGLNIVDEGLVYGLTVENKKAMVWLFTGQNNSRVPFLSGNSYECAEENYQRYN